MKAKSMTIMTTALSLAVATLAGLAASTPAMALNPQPLPPGMRVMLNPQPLPPGARFMLNPQPLPPRIQPNLPLRMR